jgi:hypothetical protein
METNSVLAKVMRAGVIGAVAAAVVVGSGGPAALGQPQPQSVPRQVPPQFPGHQGSPGPVVSVDFPGGTVAEYIEAVQRAGGDRPVNVLVPAEAAGVPVPPISLRGVTARTALEALTYAFPFGYGAKHEFGVRSFGDDPEATNAFAIMYSKGQQIGMMPGQLNQAAGPARGREQIQVFSLTELVAPPGAGEDVGVPVDVLLTAVEAALGIGAGDEEADGEGGSGAPAQVRFHEESGLLIVRGTGEQISLVSSLLGELRKDVVSRWSTARQDAAREAERRYRQKRLEVEMGLAEKELVAADKRAERFRQQVESGHAPQQLQEEAEEEVARKRAQLEMLRLEEQRPVADSQDRPQARAGTPAKAGDSGMDASVMAQLIVDLQRRVTELQAEVDRLRAGKK